MNMDMVVLQRLEPTLFFELQRRVKIELKLSNDHLFSKNVRYSQTLKSLDNFSFCHFFDLK